MKTEKNNMLSKLSKLLRCGLLLTCVQLVARDAVAADKTVFVNTDCANNGTGSANTCAGSPGGAGAYNSLANANTGEAGDLDTLARTLTIKCSGTAADAGFGGLAGFTPVPVTRYYVIDCDETEANGCNPTNVYDANYFHVQNTFDPINTNPVGNVWIKNIQITNSGTGTNGDAKAGVVFRGVGAPKLSGNIIRATGTTTDNDSNGVTINNPDFSHARVWNNFIDGFHGNGARCRTTGTGQTCTIYNNTVTNVGGDGYQLDGDSGSPFLNLKNNICYATTGPCFTFAGSFGGGYTHSANASDDATSPDGGTYQNLTFTFVNVGLKNFGLASGDTAAKDRGTTLTSDTAQAITVDKKTTSRPQGSSFDVGADELIQAGPTPTPTPTPTRNP